MNDWQRIYDMLCERWTPPRSYTVEADMSRSLPVDDVLTEDKIIADQPDWVPPADPWRPRTTLDPETSTDPTAGHQTT
jgi:hypothetical protein